MPEKKEDKNLLLDNEFSLKVKNKDKIKEIKLKKYSLAVQLKLMKSGLINKLINFQKNIKKTQDAKNDAEGMENIDFTLMGEMLETSIDVIFEMLSDDVKLSKTKEDLINTIADGEPLRFIGWIFAQFGKSNSFLAQENPMKVVPQQE